MNRALKMRDSEIAESIATKSHDSFEDVVPVQHSMPENQDIVVKKIDGFAYPINFDQGSETNMIFFVGILFTAAILILALLWYFS